MENKIKSVFAISSKSRPEILRKMTLKILNKIPKNKIYIFVEPQDYDKYLDIKEEGYNLISIEKNDMKIGYSRKFIQKYFENKNDLVWQIDDNMDSFYIRNEELKLKKIDENEILNMFIFLENKIKDYTILTLSFKPSNWFYTQEYKENTRAWGIVLLNNKLLCEKNIFYDDYLGLFEDYDICARCLSFGLKTISFYNYAFYKEMSKFTGGCQVYKNKEYSEEICIYLKKKYSNKIKIFFNEKHKIFEPKFYWHEFKEIKIYKNNLLNF